MGEDNSVQSWTASPLPLKTINKAKWSEDWRERTKGAKRLVWSKCLLETSWVVAKDTLS